MGIYDFDPSIMHEGQEDVYSVDLVLCIDGTVSMRPFINEVKNRAKKVYELLSNAMMETNRQLNDESPRVKVIVFRDYADTKTEPMEESRFFNVRNESELNAFCQYVDNIQSAGGGDLPENALEAIFTAMKSEWTPTGGSCRRQGIIVFTDTVALEFKQPGRVDNPRYPAGMPDNIEEMAQIWKYGSQELVPYFDPECARLIVYAPENQGREFKSKTVAWEDIATWPHFFPMPVQANYGCNDTDLKEAIGTFVGSL